MLDQYGARTSLSNGRCRAAQYHQGMEVDPHKSPANCGDFPRTHPAGPGGVGCGMQAAHALPLHAGFAQHEVADYAVVFVESAAWRVCGWGCCSEYAHCKA